MALAEAPMMVPRLATEPLPPVMFTPRAAEIMPPAALVTVPPSANETPRPPLPVSMMEPKLVRTHADTPGPLTALLALVASLTCAALEIVDEATGRDTPDA